MKKPKAKAPKKRIEPRDAPKPVGAKPAPPSQPIRVLAEFKKGVNHPLSVRTGSRDPAPRIAGWRCTAAWDVVHDPVTKEAFELLGAEIGNVVTLFHGTSAHNIADITTQGLRPGAASCMFGSGIYMGPPAKAWGYTGSGWRRNYGSSDARYLLEVKAALGKVRECGNAEKHTLSKLRELGFNSVGGLAGYTTSWYGTLRHSENVVYSPSQVQVQKIYEYQEVEQPQRPVVPPSGACPILKEIQVETTSRNRAFKDLINKKPCGKTGFVRVRCSDDQTHWLCNSCIQELRLRVGSTIQVNEKWRGPKMTAIRIRELLDP